MGLCVSVRQPLEGPVRHSFLFCFCFHEGRSWVPVSPLRERLRVSGAYVTPSSSEAVTKTTNPGAIPLPPRMEAYQKLRHCSQREDSRPVAALAGFNPKSWI